MIVNRNGDSILVDFGNLYTAGNLLERLRREKIRPLPPKTVLSDEAALPKVMEGNTRLFLRTVSSIVAGSRFKVRDPKGQELLAGLNTEFLALGSDLSPVSVLCQRLLNALAKAAAALPPTESSERSQRSETREDAAQRHDRAIIQADRLKKALKERSEFVKESVGYELWIPDGHSDLVKIMLKKDKEILWSRDEEVMSFIVQEDGSITGLGISTKNELRGKDLSGNKIAKALFTVLEQAMIPGAHLVARVGNIESRKTIAEKCEVDGNDLYFRQDDGALLLVVEENPADSSRTISVEDVLAQTLTGHLLAQASFRGLNISDKHFVDKGAVGRAALIQLLNAKKDEGRGVAIPGYYLYAVKIQEGIRAEGRSEKPEERRSEARGMVSTQQAENMMPEEVRRLNAIME